METDRRQHVTLGMTDRIVFGACTALILGLAAWGWNMMQEGLKSLTAATQNNTITIAVMSTRLDTLNAQLADVPDLRDRVNDLENHVDENTRVLRERK